MLGEGPTLFAIGFSKYLKMLDSKNTPELRCCEALRNKVESLVFAEKDMNAQ